MRPFAPAALALLCIAALLAACGRYADFALLEPGVAEEGRYEWVPIDQPVLTRGPSAEFDSVDALNPSVIQSGGTLLNFYSGFDGKSWTTGLARSSDGLSWTRHGRVLTPSPQTWEGAAIAANGASVHFNNSILHLYQAGEPPRIGLARSRDGVSWEKHAAPVLGYGPRGAWDERATGDPYVFVFDNQLYLYYLGEDRARRQRLGVARSNDGIHWIRHRANPILGLGPDGSFDETGLGEPAVWHDRGRWWMLYTARDRHEIRRLGLASSTDGIAWTRTPLVIEGRQPWNSKVLCDPTVLVEPSRVRVWFGGGDVAHPAENIHGQIGYGELRWKPGK